MEHDSLTIFGAGAWGSALAHAAQRAGSSPLLWRRGEDLEHALAWGDLFLLALPAQQVRSFLQMLPSPPKGPLILASKGIEQDTGLLMHEVVASLFPHHPCIILSGPNLATEVAQGLPTAVTLAAREKTHAQRVAQALGSPVFRPYLTTDVIGAQVGGALKNVMAIACGILKGQGLGENATATLLTRGLAEIVRFGVALGASPETFLGLSGVGDLFLTCTSAHSRNTVFGVKLGRGCVLKDAFGKNLVEGATTAQSVLLRAQTLGVSMPISWAVSQVLRENMSISQAIQTLLSRPFREEEFA